MHQFCFPNTPGDYYNLKVNMQMYLIIHHSTKRMNNGDIAPHILKLIIRECEWKASRCSRLALRYILEKRPSGVDSRSRCYRNAPQGIEPRFPPLLQHILFTTLNYLHWLLGSTPDPVQCASGPNDVVGRLKAKASCVLFSQSDCPTARPDTDVRVTLL
jgi:hypothetical protein